jgi:tRNA A37 methylthiotransferase MiaB
MEGQVQHSIRRDRTTIVRQVLDEAERTYISRRLGKSAKVLFEGKTRYQGEWIWQGWSEDFLRVFASSKEDMHNQIMNVQLEELTTSKAIIAHTMSQSD